MKQGWQWKKWANNITKWTERRFVENQARYQNCQKRSQLKTYLERSTQVTNTDYRNIDDDDDGDVIYLSIYGKNWK